MNNVQNFDIYQYKISEWFVPYGGSSFKMRSYWTWGQNLLTPQTSRGFPNTFQQLFKATHSTSQWSVHQRENGTACKKWSLLVFYCSQYNLMPLLYLNSCTFSADLRNSYVAPADFQLSKQKLHWKLTKLQARNQYSSSLPSQILQANCGEKWGGSSSLMSSAAHILLLKWGYMFVSDVGREQVTQTTLEYYWKRDTFSACFVAAGKRKLFLF